MSSETSSATSSSSSALGDSAINVGINNPGANAAAVNAAVNPGDVPDTQLPSWIRPMKVPWELNEFNGSDVSSYLRKYNLLAKDYGLQGTAKLNRFSAYCKMSIISEVESLSGYEEGNWDTFEKALKRYYFDKDPQQKEYQIPYLRALADNQRQKNSADRLKIYATQFRRIAKVLLKEHKLSEYGACSEFYGGLPEQIQDDVQRSVDIDWTKPEMLSIDKIAQTVIDIEDKYLERRRILHSHSTPALHASSSSQPGPASVVRDYVPPMCP